MRPEQETEFARSLAEMRAEAQAIERKLRGMIGREMDAFFQKWGVPISYIETSVECYQTPETRENRSVLARVRVGCSLF